MPFLCFLLLDNEKRITPRNVALVIKNCTEKEKITEVYLLIEKTKERQYFDTKNKRLAKFRFKRQSKFNNINKRKSIFYIKKDIRK